MLVDTVGFLQDLPHHLIEAFKSTLESALHCDLALIVCDAVGDYETQLNTTLDTLRGMNFSAPYLIVVNKCDLTQEGRFPQDAVLISAKEKRGLDTLKQRIFEALASELIRAKLSVPYRESAAYGALRGYLYEQNVVYTDDGAEITAVIPAIYADKFRDFRKI